MFRVLTTAAVAVFATLYYGIRVILLAHRGDDADADGYVAIQRAWSRVVLRGAGVTVQFENASFIREPRARVIVANHASLFDILAIASHMHVPYGWVMKRELGNIVFFGAAVTAAGHAFIDRSDRESSLRSLAEMGERMRKEKLSVVMFPEGTRTVTGEMRPFKKGAFMLAIRSGAEVVPAAITGSFAIKPKGRLRVRRGVIKVRLDEPIATSSYSVDDRNDLTTRVRTRLREMIREMDEKDAPQPPEH